MINPKLLEALNQQIQMEGESSMLYLAAANWLAYKGFKGAAKFMFIQADEEREHMMKLIRFLLDAGHFPTIPGFPKPQSEFDSFRAVFEKAYQHEQKVSKSFHDMAEKALNEKDFVTFQFIQWFIEEQVEEEELFKSVLDKLDLIGETGHVLYMLDRELGERK